MLPNFNIIYPFPPSPSPSLLQCKDVFEVSHWTQSRSQKIRIGKIPVWDFLILRSQLKWHFLGIEASLTMLGALCHLPPPFSSEHFGNFICSTFTSLYWFLSFIYLLNVYILFSSTSIHIHTCICIILVPSGL